jgi:hypothetical protein
VHLLHYEALAASPATATADLLRRCELREVPAVVEFASRAVHASRPAEAPPNLPAPLRSAIDDLLAQLGYS